MRIYVNDNQTDIVTIICNKCKKEVEVENNIIKDGMVSIDTVFGYFSNKDGEKHSFDLCEECYDKMITGFQIYPEIQEVKELL